MSSTHLKSRPRSTQLTLRFSPFRVPWQRPERGRGGRRRGGGRSRGFQMRRRRPTQRQRQRPSQLTRRATERQDKAVDEQSFLFPRSWCEYKFSPPPNVTIGYNRFLSCAQFIDLPPRLMRSHAWSWREIYQGTSSIVAGRAGRAHRHCHRIRAETLRRGNGRGGARRALRRPKVAAFATVLLREKRDARRVTDTGRTGRE